MTYIGYPLVGDAVYGGRLKIPPGCSDDFANALRNFKRQALHAASLGLEHPTSREWMQWQAEVPNDMQHLIELAEQDSRNQA